MEKTSIKYLLMNVLAYLLLKGMAYAAISSNWTAPSTIIITELIFNSVRTLNFPKKKIALSTKRYTSLPYSTARLYWGNEKATYICT